MKILCSQQIIKVLLLLSPLVALCFWGGVVERFPLKCGQYISFKRDSLGLVYLERIGSIDNFSSGWSYPEAWGTWSFGEKVKIRLPIPSGCTAKNIYLDLRAYVNDKRPLQKIDIYMDGKFFETITLGDKAANSIELPIRAKSLRQNSIEVTFENYEPISPFELGLGQDKRRIGIGIIGAEIK